MVTAVRQAFNPQFNQASYQKYLAELDAKFPGAIEFRVAETPIFIDKAFKEKVLNTCESIVDIIIQPDFLSLTEKAIPPELMVPNENKHTHFIAFDFGICENEKGELEPQLIEMQGFPTLFAYQIWHDEVTRKYFSIPEQYSAFLNGFDKASYIELLKEIIIGKHLPEEVVLLEILPHNQKTKIDFYCTTEYIGIPVVIQEKGKLLFEPLNVEWVPHPNWFYRISKYMLPFIQHPFVPETVFLNELKNIPEQLENYVLKPLFSFAGQGVVIDLTKADIDAVKDPENWILQKKVKYAAVIQTPDEPAKAEIRIFYFWKEGEARPVATNNLARLSKGKMIGVRYNKDKEWVGGSLAYFES
jgi:hypothetical protein